MKRKLESAKGDLREMLKVSLPSDYGWKILDKLVHDLDYLLTESEKKKVLGIIRRRDFDAYLSLSEDWGPQRICPERDNKPAAMRARYQIVSLLKKYRFPSDNQTRRAAAKEKFLAAEQACSEYNQSGYISLKWCKDDRYCNVYTYARAFLEKLLGTDLPDDSELTLWSRHGPGSNLDTKDRQTSLYFKYSEWPYSCTQLAAPLARKAIKDDERWLGALEDDYRSRYGIPKHAILNQETFWSNVLTIVPGNRIAFVPKNALTDRSIAIEPSLNLYLQLGVDGFIRRRLKRWKIDLDSQTKNRELARRGSRDWEWSENFCTLDLSAASDTVSLSVCEALLPAKWYNLLLKLRSPVGILDDEIISYEKISSMGNGYTFALETAIFAAIVYGVQREFQGHYDGDNCAIYGDDIIVEKSIVHHVVAVLNLCGFKINDEKSFTEGPFRESCGADWFMGTPIRPVFLTSLPTSVMELWTDLNRLKRILSLRFLVEDSQVESLMNTWIPVAMTAITGPFSDEDFDSYRHVRTPSGTYKNSLWVWKRLVIRPKPLRGCNFLFRKLMHSLRGSHCEEPSRCYVSTSSTWKGARLTGAGSRFVVTKPSLVTAGYTTSVADIWRSEYTEI